MSSPIEGIHHITAVRGDPVRNLRFCRDVLGLRFIKKTVSFAVDEPLETLGTEIKLPAIHEPLRARIEKALPRLDT